MRSPLGERTTVATLLVLTFTAGLIDAVCSLRLGHVFVANMTGNVVFLGVSVANSAGRTVLGSFVSLTAYMCGAVTGGRLWRLLHHRPRAGHTAVWRKIASISMIMLGSCVGALLLRVFAAGAAIAGVTGTAAALVTCVAMVYAFAPTHVEEPTAVEG